MDLHGPPRTPHRHPWTRGGRSGMGAGGVDRGGALLVCFEDPSRASPRDPAVEGGIEEESFRAWFGLDGWK
eukprot:7396955-Lingulodinium_polyedra.AAC.1